MAVVVLVCGVVSLGYPSDWGCFHTGPLSVLDLFFLFVRRGVNHHAHGTSLNFSRTRTRGSQVFRTGGWFLRNMAITTGAGVVGAIGRNKTRWRKHRSRRMREVFRVRIRVGFALRRHRRRRGAMGEIGEEVGQSGW